MGRARRVGSGGPRGRGRRAGGAMRQDGRGDAADEGGVDLRPNGSPLFRRAKDVMAAGVRGGTGRAVRMGGDGRGRERARARIAKARRMMYTFPMIRRKFRQKPYRRSLAASTAAPWLRLGALLLALAALGLLLALVIVPWFSRWAESGLPYPWSEPTPAPSAPPAAPTAPPAADGPVRSFVPGAEADFRRVADASVFDGTLLFAAGDDAAAARLYRLDLACGALSAIDAAPQNDAFRFPVENDRYLAVFDARAEGGGDIRVLDRQHDAWRTVRTVEAGAPRLRLDGSRLAWLEEEDGGACALYLCDLSAPEDEPAAIVRAEEAGGLSAPYLTENRLIYADGAADDAVIHSVFPAGGEPSSFPVGGPAFEPQAAGTSWAWMSAPEGGELYLSAGSAAPRCIAHGVAAYCLSGDAAVYGVADMVFCCRIADGSTRLLSDTGTRAQLLCAGDGYAVWRVPGGAARDMIQYLRLG